MRTEEPFFSSSTPPFLYSSPQLPVTCFYLPAPPTPNSDWQRQKVMNSRTEFNSLSCVQKLWESLSSSNDIQHISQLYVACKLEITALTVGMKIKNGTFQSHIPHFIFCCLSPVSLATSSISSWGIQTGSLASLDMFYPSSNGGPASGSPLSLTSTSTERRHSCQMSKPPPLAPFILRGLWF